MIRTPSIFSTTSALWWTAALLVLAAGTVTGELQGQNVLIDEGTFEITISGEAAGTETFSIRRVGTGADTRIIARATVEVTLPEGRLSMAPLTQASGGDLSLTAYQVKVSGDREEEISFRLDGRRFVANIRTEAGERVREFRAEGGSVLLEEGVAHQYYFLAPLLSSSATPITVIVPRAASRSAMTLSPPQEATVTIAGRTLPARQVRIEGSGEAREIWFDSEGRVLRVRVPSLGYEAVRTAVPSAG